MHHFIYPSQDTYITNALGYEGLNFGLDEILRVGTNVETIRVTELTSSYPIDESVTNYCVQNFSGSVYGTSLYGTASFALGTIIGGVYCCPIGFSSSYYTGTLTGSYLSNSLSSSNFTGSLTGFSGSMSGSVNGYVSGSLITEYFSIFSGSLVGFTGKIISGFVVGLGTRNNVYKRTVMDKIYSNRALVQFDITSISQSIVNGNIANPSFTLKMNIAREFELPITYKLYAFPIAESWVMGDGYLSDGGSEVGASWNYRDRYQGIVWSATGSTYVQGISATQSFNYQVGDINMDVTNIANAWLNGSVPNYGILILSSDEFEPTASGMALYFFSKDTNTIYEPVLDVGWNSGSGGWSWVTGSLTTASISTSSIPAGIYGTVTDSGSVSGPIYGTFTGFGDIDVQISNSLSYSFDTNTTTSITTSLANGVISGLGLSGNIISMSIYGHISGSVISSIVNVYSKCGVCQPPPNANTGIWSGNDPGSQAPGGAWWVSQYNGWDANGSDPWAGWDAGGADFALDRAIQYQGHDVYGWGHGDNPFNQYDWWEWPGAFFHGDTNDYTTHNCSHHNSGSVCGQVTCSLLMGTLLDGTYSGSVFTSSFVNGYILQKGILIGNWNEAEILGTHLSSSYPILPSYPDVVYVTFFGQYINGLAFGSITGLSASYGLYNYGIFDGVFVNGLLAGFPIHAPFSGSILTASLYYTSSVTYTSNSLDPVDFNRGFVTVIQNVPSTVKAGNVIRVNVFARPEFPIKNFNRQTQFTQFLTPQYLPSSSYYAIKDNETEQIILDFDNYTQISCDTNGNYFMLDTTAFPQERYFKLLIKTENNGAIYTFDKGNVFKIVR